jgi:hypothetical protein
MFERESAFYEAHKTELREKYLNKWLVIADNSLFGAFDTPKEAFAAAGRRYNPGEFMLHRPSDDDVIIETGPLIPEMCSDDDHEPESTMHASSGKLVTFTYA